MSGRADFAQSKNGNEIKPYILCAIYEMAGTTVGGALLDTRHDSTKTL